MNAPNSDDLFDLMSQFEKYEPREGYIRAPFGWPGGKWHSLKHLIPLIPQGETFVDACGGSGIVTLNSPDWFKQKVYNDRHSGLVAFYRCIRDHSKMEQLVERLRLVVHSREEFVWSKETWHNHSDDVERAARWYYMIRMSFSQLGRNFGRSTRGINILAEKFGRGLDLFPTIHDCFKKALVENLDCLQCMRDFDGHHTVHYVDPDYIGTNPIYQHTVDHKRLLETVFEMKGWVAVSGYANTMYDSQNWDYRYEWEVPVRIVAQAFNEGNHLQGKENHMHRGQTATEVLWVKDFA